MKDSQDWLDEILVDLYAGKGMYAKYPNGVGKATAEGSNVQEAKSAIRKRILQEALEILKDEPDNSNLEAITMAEISDFPCHTRNKLRQELRNKFNDKYKED